MADTLVSAPAKVILHGEHAVVYGRTALAAALGLRSTLKLSDTAGDAVELELPDTGLQFRWEAGQLASLRGELDLGEGEVPRPASPTTITRLARFLGRETPDSAALAFLYLYLGSYSPSHMLSHAFSEKTKSEKIEPISAK